MLFIRGILKTFSKPNCRTKIRKPQLLALEDRVVPAVTAFYNSTASSLTINLQNSNDAASIVYDSADGYEINSGAVTILGGYDGTQDTVDRLIIQDTGDSAFGQSVTLSATSGSAPISLDDGLITTGVESVTISSAIDGVNANGISFVDASTKIQLGADLSTNDQPISFGGPVLLGANVILESKDSSGGTITFSGTVNTVAALASKSLIIDSGTEGVSFANSLGATKSLNVVSVTASSVSLTGNISATGNVTIDAPLTLNRAVSISSTGGAGTFILFKGTIDSDSVNTPRSLTVGMANQSGTTEFQNTLGATTPLGAVTVNRTGTITIEDDITTANAPVTFKGAVVLSGSTVITTKTVTGKGGNVAFSGTVDASASGTETLTIVAGSAGAVSFGGAVGGTTPLGVTNVGGKTITLSGNLTTSNNADITLSGAVVLNATSTLSSANGDITLTGSVNGSSNGGQSLTVNAGTGDVLINADVGNLRALNSFSVSHSNDTTISKSVKASTVSILSDDNTNTPSITIADTASITANTTLTMTEKNGVIDVSGRFYGTVTVTGESTTKNASTDTTTLKASSNSNFTIVGTDVSDRSKGTLTKTQPGKTATITFSNINALDLAGGTSGNAFTLTEWFYDAAIDGKGGTDSVTVNRAQDATSGLAFTLDSTDGIKIVAPTGSFGAGTTSPITIDYALMSIESASLAGGAGNDSFDIGGWSAKASVIGNAGLDELIWSASADSLLTPISFSAGTLVASLSSINSAQLENTGANSRFSISGFVGAVDITGVSSSTVTATYNSNFSLTGASDTVGTITTGNTTIDFTAGNVSLIGGVRDNVFTLDGTFTGVVTLDGGVGNDTYNITLPASTNTTNQVTVSDTGNTSRDTIIARSITGTGLLSKTTTSAPNTPLVGYIVYIAGGTATSKPRINFSGIEFFTLQ